MHTETSIKRSFLTCLLLAAATFAGAAPVALAAVPDGINYQGYLTDSDGSPVDTTVTIAFGLYNTELGGVPLWNDSTSVNVDQGLFSLTLGNPVNPIPAGLFDGPVFLGLFVAGEELLPRRPFSSNAYSFKAQDADTVDGVDAAALDQSSEVTTLQSSLSSVSSDVSSVQATAVSNEARIDTLETAGGDITGVTAGAGLTGGGAAGSVSIAIASGGIDNSMLAPASVTGATISPGAVSAISIQDNTVGTADIQDGAVLPNDLNELSSYTIGGLDLGGSGLEINSDNDIRIVDNFNRIRWLQNDGLTELAYISVRDVEVSMRDASRERDIFISNVNGVGIAGAPPAPAYDVAMNSLSVNGALQMGYERVTATYIMDIEVPSCASHGGDPCWFGSGVVSCPVGKKVVGGGPVGIAPRYGAVGRSYPNSESSWLCSTSYDLADASQVCYAICANIQ
ncbi:MAG: hypothetical protein AB8G18_19435 [Gammaproteobacteria bacterium]